MSSVVEVRRGVYHDSVSLMQASSRVSAAEGVEAALVAMGTPLNLDLLAGLGFDAPGDAGPNDLVVALRTVDDGALDGARARVEAALDQISAGHGGAPGGFGAAPPPRTTASAATRTPADLALVSVPGPYAFVEAMDALESGLSVMVFSDNVPVRQEVALKDEGARRGLLVMGPDCGTALVGGVGLGFANAVRPGPVGVVAATGTGAQQLTCLLDGAGVGVSHVLGVGGRALSSAVAGRSTLQALDLLDDDPATALVVVVSKPPAPEVAARVRERAARLSTPVVLALLGRQDGQAGQDGHRDLTATAEHVATRLGHAWVPPRSWPAPVVPAGTYRTLRGLFAGGTLCDEAMVVASERLRGPVRSNIPLSPDLALGDDLRAPGHWMVDFGDDRLTQGRPHPMIDPKGRVDRLLAEARDPQAGVLLLDVVLGYGADPDPAAALAPAIREAHRRAEADGRDVAVVVSLCGASGDAQGLDAQAGRLAEAGASVYLSNAAAADAAVSLVDETAGVEA